MAITSAQTVRIDQRSYCNARFGGASAAIGRVRPWWLSHVVLVVAIRRPRNSTGDRQKYLQTSRRLQERAGQGTAKRKRLQDDELKLRP